MSQIKLIGPDYNPEAHPSAIQVAKLVWSLTPGFHRMFWWLIFLGVIASFAEMIGITVLVSLLFIQMSGQHDAAAMEYVPNWLATLLGSHLSIGAIVGLLLVTVVIRLSLTVWEGVLNTKISTKISEQMREKLYSQLLDMTLNNLKSHDRSELLSVLATDSYQVASAHAGIIQMGTNLATIAIFGTALLLLSWQLAVIAVIGGLAHTLIMRLFSRASERVGLDTSQNLEDMTHLSWTTLQAMRSIRCFGVQPLNKAYFTSLSRRVSQLLTISDNIGHMVSIISEALTLAILILVILSASWFGIPFQTVLAATALLYRLQPHAKEFDRSRLKLHEWDAPIRRTNALLRTDDKAYSPTGHLPYEKVRKAITFEGISYVYPGMTQPCINHLSFTIPVGGTTAIRGPSGAGKSTIVNMLLQLMEPSGGKILIDGVDLLEIRNADWLKAIAIAGQDVELIEGTVRENILMMREGFSDEQVKRAAQIAGIADFIETLPEGYEEWLGDEALKISGGQRQRVGMARALLGEPDILILDEATNALDEATEKEVLENVRRAYEGRTIIFISHRPINIHQIDHTITLG